MPRQHLPPMPKLAPFALADAEPRPKRPIYLFVFFALFAIPLFLSHLSVIGLPYFWDEQGQFIPTALDLFRHGLWIARSTLPNVHPPGVEAYLALWYEAFGYSIAITRVAMLLVAAAGLLLTFLLAIRLSRDTEGTPAFWPPVLLLVSPLFYTQSMMAQLDMPAMVLTLWALLLFLQERIAWSAAACVLLVMAKETGIVVPLVFFILLCARREWKKAALFTAPALALAVWLIVLHRATGYWLGNPEFAHYNVGYSLHPARIVFTLARRFYYLFVAEFRWIGTLAIVFALYRTRVFAGFAWRLTLWIALATVVLVSVLGGAELERYLLPVLPFFYIAVAVAFSACGKWVARIGVTALAIGLLINLFWNPPYPFPYENNWSMVDFVRLQQTAAAYSERNLADKSIATAWPYTAALRDPDFGFVKHPLKTVETGDFHTASITAIPRDRFDVLITYTRTWAPENGVIAIPLVRRFLTHFYGLQPDITAEQCARLGLVPRITWKLRGQRITVYAAPQR